MERYLVVALALVAHSVTALPQDPSGDSPVCQYPPADLPAPASSSTSCSDQSTFVMRINDCSNPYNGHYVTSSASDSSLILDTTSDTPWGPTTFLTSEDPTSHLITTGSGTSDTSKFSNHAMTSSVNTAADSDALENQYGYMALHDKGEDESNDAVIWQQAFTSVGDFSDDGYDGVFFEWAGDARCSANFVRFTSVQDDGSVKIGAACQSVVGQIPGQVQEAQFEAVYTCQQ